MKPSSLFLLLIVSLAVLPQPSQGQWIAGPPRGPGPLRINELVNAPRELPRTYWLEGGIAGGIGLGVLLSVFVGGLCDSDSCSNAAVGAFAAGGAVGFVAGALVGGQFRKAAKDTTAAR